MESITQYVEQRLKLKVNREKSVVDRATKRPLLGFGFFAATVRSRCGSTGRPANGPKDRLRQLTSRRWGVSMERRIDRDQPLHGRVDGLLSRWPIRPRRSRSSTKWLRRRLRQVRWKEWKRLRTKRRNLIALGIPEDEAHQWACTRKGYWRIAGSAPLQRALPNAYWTEPGPRRDSPTPTAVSGTPSEPPDADPHVRWCGRRRGEPGAYPICQTLAVVSLRASLPLRDTRLLRRRRSAPAG